MADIMIIDDDVEFTSILKVFLKDAGHAVSSLDQTEGAIALLEANTPDVLVLDVMFPENPAGGFDLARDIRHREALKALPILMLTGVNQEFPMDFSADDIDQEWLPVQDFVEKTAEMPQIVAKVEALLGT